jgi:MFS family permease
VTAEIDAGHRGSSILARVIAPYAVLKASHTLRVLLACHLLSRIVQWLYLVALFVVGYDLTHSAHTVGLLTFLRFLPNALLLPVSGALTDHWNRKLLMVISNGGRAACTVGLLLVHSASMLPLDYVLLFFATVLSSLFRPALVATLPSIVDERELLSANSLVTQAEMISLGMGPALAGVLLLAGHVYAAFLIACVVFGACAIALALTPVPDRRPTEALTGMGWVEHLGSGFAFLTKEYQGVLMGYSLALGGMQILSGAAWTLSVVLSERVFGFGGQGVGFLNAAYGIGGIVGGIFLGPVLARGGFSVVFTGSIAASCLFSMLYGFSPLGTLALLFNVGAGSADVFSKVSAMSIIQAATPNEMMGRVFGAFESILIIGQLLGAIAVGAALAALGPREANFVFCLVGLSVLLLCMPLLRHTSDELGSRIFLRSVPALQPVAFHLLDDLAARVRVETFPHGTAIVREGELGTALYIIKRGQVEVVARGDGTREVHIADLSRMDYFGELALLREAPRNASVLARGPVEVYRLDGADFKALVGRVDNLRSVMNRAGVDRDLHLQSRMLAGF